MDVQYTTMLLETDEAILFAIRNSPRGRRVICQNLGITKSYLSKIESGEKPLTESLRTRLRVVLLETTTTKTQAPSVNGRKEFYGIRAIPADQ